MEVGSRNSEVGSQPARKAAHRAASFRLPPNTLRLLLVLLALTANAARADEPAATVTRLQIGFSDRYKVGYWTPIRVTLQGGNERIQARIELIVPDGDGVPALTTSPPNKPILILPGREITVPMFAKIGQTGGDIVVKVVVDGEVLVKQTFSSLGTPALPVALNSNTPLAVIVGNPLGITPTTERTEEKGERTTVYAPINTAEQFPTRWYGYESADTVILTTADPEIYRQLSRDMAQVAALDRWVRLGGRLILCVGSRAEEVLAPDAPLAGFAPGKLAGRVTLKQATAWETFVETSERLDASTATDAAGEFRLDVPRLEDVQGRIEAFDGARPTDLPLVVRTPRGFGEIVFVAADLDRPPFTRWQARKEVLAKLLGDPKPATPKDENAAEKDNATYGFDDIAGQLRSALEQFNGVKLVPFALVATLILVYILAIGPLDYLVLKRVFKRMEWTWFTFPAIVLAFSLTAYFLAYWLKGDQLLTNQVDVIDYDIETKLVRGSTWTNLFSPRVDSYNVSYQPKLPGNAPLSEQQVLVSWAGLPGEGFGGMNSQTGAAALFTGAYDFSPSLDSITGLPVAVWSTKGLTARWDGISEPMVTAELVDKGDRLLSGVIANKLDEPLTDCVLVYERWAYPIGKLDPHARFSIENKLEQQTFETYFKHISLLNEKDTTSKYSPENLEVGRIVETMMFHQHLGGSNYTKLSNQYQQFIDLSGLLRAGRAILIGRATHGGAQLMNNDKPLGGGDDRRWTFYRFVFPVQKKDGG